MSGTNPSFKADGNIKPARFVTQTGAAANRVLQASTNDVIAGISQDGLRRAPGTAAADAYAAVQGEDMRVFGNGETCRVSASDTTITAGMRLKSDSDGEAVPMTFTETVATYYGARALEACTVAHQLIRVQVEFGVYGET